MSRSKYRNRYGFTIFVSPSCVPVTSYAIYSALYPIYDASITYDSSLIDVAYAGVGNFPKYYPKRFTGYYCIDSSGNNITITKSYIPGHSNATTVHLPNVVTDGKCHAPLNSNNII